MIKLALKDMHATARLGGAIARACLEWQPESDEPILIALHGPLGAGKTALVKAVGKALQIEEVISSPTFTMLNEYHSGQLALYHMDLYRAGETGESMDLDTLALELDESADADTILMIEWPQYFIVEGRDYFEGRDLLVIEMELSKYCGQSEDSLERTPEPQPALSERDNCATDVELVGLPQKSSIKEGDEEQRVATIKALGEKSEALLRAISAELSTFLINC